MYLSVLKRSRNFPKLSFQIINQYSVQSAKINPEHYDKYYRHDLEHSTSKVYKIFS